MLIFCVNHDIKLPRLNIFVRTMPLCQNIFIISDLVSETNILKTPETPNLDYYPFFCERNCTINFAAQLNN